MTHPFAGLSGGASGEGLELDYPGQLIGKYHFRTLKDTKEIYYYDGRHGVFRPGGETIIENEAETNINEVTTYKVSEIVNHIRRRTYTDRDVFNPSIEWLACKNCMVNVLTGETRSFGPEFMCTTSIPVKFDLTFSTSQISYFFRMIGEKSQLNTLCPKITKFLHETMAFDDIDLFLDYLAYCLWREYKYAHWMLLNGAGFNGKSILLKLVEMFLGKENVAGETLDRLLHRNFAVGNLFGKMANVDADVSPTVMLDNTGILKKLTGNDTHTGEFKFKPPFKFVNYAKLFFSCNKIPMTEDLTDANIRRFLIINFTQQFFGDREDPHLIDKLTTEEEFTGLLSELIARLPRVVTCGIRKITNDFLAETYEKYVRGSDPIRFFIEKATIIDPNTNTPKIDMYEYHTKFCVKFGLTPESEQSFSRKLTTDFNLKYDRCRIKGERVYCWIGVKLVDWSIMQEEAQLTMMEAWR